MDEQTAPRSREFAAPLDRAYRRLFIAMCSKLVTPPPPPPPCPACRRMHAHARTHSTHRRTARARTHTNLHKMRTLEWQRHFAAADAHSRKCGTAPAVLERLSAVQR